MEVLGFRVIQGLHKDYIEGEWKRQGKLLLRGYTGFGEVHGTYNLLSNCSYKPNISRVTVVMEFMFRL